MELIQQLRERRVVQSEGSGDTLIGDVPVINVDPLGQGAIGEHCLAKAQIGQL